MQRSQMEGQRDLQETRQDGGGNSCNHRDNDLSSALPFPFEPQPPIGGQKDAAFQQLCIGNVVNQPVEDEALPCWLVDPEQEKAVNFGDTCHFGTLVTCCRWRSTLETHTRAS